MDLNLEPKPENPARKRQIALAISIVAIVALAVAMFTKRWQRVGQDDHRVGMGLISVEECREGKCVTRSNKDFVENRINRTVGELSEAITNLGKLRGFVSRDLSTVDEFGDGYDMYGEPRTFENRLCSGDLDGAYQRMLDEERVLDPRTAKRPGDEVSTAFMCRLVMNNATDPRKLPEKKSMVGWLTGWITMILLGLSVISLGAAVIQVAQGKFFVGPIAPTSWSILCLFLSLIVGCIFVASNPTRGENLDVLLGYQLGVGWSFWLFGAGVVLGIAGTIQLTKFKPAPVDHFLP
jgi:hypothetical protein